MTSEPTSGADTGPAQLTFDLALRPASGADDFLVSDANAAAVAFLDRWPDWAAQSALLVGPAASGKSHLGKVWQARSGATACPAASLGEEAVATFARPEVRSLLIEDIDRGIAEERILFHLLNQARETGRHLLLTARALPGEMTIRLPDLRSRVRALPLMSIAEPDDALLRGVLVKLFTDRQIAVEPPVIAYLVRHMERSFEAARRTVAAIDRLALARRQKVTRALAADVLARPSGPDAGDDAG